MRKSYGFRTFRCLELALYHSLGKLPEPESTHEFFWRALFQQLVDGAHRFRVELRPPVIRKKTVHFLLDVG
jgi:hypothetical protein